MPPMIDGRTQNESDLAHDLRPHMQRLTCVLPGRKWQIRPQCCAYLACHDLLSPQKKPKTHLNYPLNSYKSAISAWSVASYTRRIARSCSWYSSIVLNSTTVEVSLQASINRRARLII